MGAYGEDNNYIITEVISIRGSKIPKTFLMGMPQEFSSYMYIVCFTCYLKYRVYNQYKLPEKI